MLADFHVHSTASDGVLSASELVSAALSAGLDYLAVTDHDSVAMVSEAVSSAQGTRLTIVPGVELSSIDGDLDVHVLAYFIDPTDQTLLRMLESNRAARLERAAAIVDSLRAEGYKLSLDEVLKLSDGGATGRSHIARALVAAGHVESTAQAFEQLIGRGRPHYLPKTSPTPQQLVSAMSELGAVTIVAHPGITGVDPIVHGLIEAGLHGLEAYHADHSVAQREHYAMMAVDHGLLTTGGSDFHGPGAPNPPLGSVDIPDHAIASFIGADPR